MAADLEGRATPEAIAGFAPRTVVGDDADSNAGPHRVALSPIGVGVHGIAQGDVLHARAITHALSRGCTWLVLSDTRPVAAAALGRCLRDAVAAGSLARETLVLGVEIDAHHDATAMHDALAQVRAALGVAFVDLVIARLHDPLDDCDIDALARTTDGLREVVRRDHAAGFALCADVRPHCDAGALARRLVLARDGDVGCRAWFVPTNPIEHAAIASLPDGRSPSSIAHAMGIATIAIRPISARTADGPLRLVETRAAELTESLTGLRRLEGAWASGLGRRLRGAAGDAVDLFRWSAVLSDPTLRGPDREAWQTLRHEVIAPHVGRAAAALLGHLQGSDRDEFAAWWQAYGTTLHHTFAAIEHVATHVDPAQRIGQLIDPLLPAGLRHAPLPVRAVGFALSVGATAVRVGIRTPAEAAMLTDAFAEPPAPIVGGMLDDVLRTIARAHPPMSPGPTA